ncbi:MAG: hypothetical protein ACYC65_05435 [Candidatus Limnocylindrales bacterium]
MVSGLLALALLAIILVVFARTPENRAEVQANVGKIPWRVMVLVMGSSFWLPLAGLVLALLLVILGLFPAQQEALYLSAVGLGLLMSALGLFVGVFWRERPEVA